MKQKTDKDYYVELKLIVDVTEVFIDNKLKIIPNPTNVAVLHSEQFADGWTLQRIKEKMLEELGFTAKTRHHFISTTKPKKYKPVTYSVKKERSYYGKKVQENAFIERRS